MPSTLAEAIKIADMYALGDPTQPSLMPAELRRDNPAQDGVGTYRRNDRQDYHNKRREERLDYRYGSNQVAAVDQDQPGASSSQRQKSDGKRPWVEKKQWQERPKYTFEIMLDQPCIFHTSNPSKPTNHTTRQCSWFQHAGKGDGNLPPPPPPLTGANTQVMNAP